MVRGLDKFREQFRAYAGQYALIGGAACDLLMEEAGLGFRATKDLNIVLSVETLDASFVRAFWDFVRTGKYRAQQSATGERRYYRFLKPEKDEYPFMLELFARKPDMLDLAEGAHLTPIPVDEEISSLSAILMDDAYYAFLNSGKKPSKASPSSVRNTLFRSRHGHGLISPGEKEQVRPSTQNPLPSTRTMCSGCTGYSTLLSRQSSRRKSARIWVFF